MLIKLPGEWKQWRADWSKCSPKASIFMKHLLLPPWTTSKHNNSKQQVLHRVVSKPSSTSPKIRENFPGRAFHDLLLTSRLPRPESTPWSSIKAKYSHDDDPNNNDNQNKPSNNKSSSSKPQSQPKPYTLPFRFRQTAPF